MMSPMRGFIDYNAMWRFHLDFYGNRYIFQFWFCVVLPARMPHTASDLRGAQKPRTRCRNPRFLPSKWLKIKLLWSWSRTIFPNCLAQRKTCPHVWWLVGVSHCVSKWTTVAPKILGRSSCRLSLKKKKEEKSDKKTRWRFEFLSSQNSFLLCV